MLCLYCHEKIPSSNRALGSFCSIGHRSMYYQRSLRRSGLSRNLGAFQPLPLPVEVHGVPPVHPHQYVISTRPPGAWHLSTSRARGIPGVESCRARLTETRPIALARREAAMPAPSPKHAGGCVLPGGLEGSPWKAPAPWIPLGALAGLIPESAIPPVRFWETAGSTAALRRKRDRTQMSSSGLLPRLQGLKPSPEKALAPVYHALESTSRDSPERLSRQVRVALPRDHSSPSLQAFPERHAPAVVGEPVYAIPHATPPIKRVEIVESQSARIQMGKKTAHAVSGFELQPIPMFPPDRSFRPRLEPAMRYPFQPARPEIFETGDARLDPWHRTSLPTSWSGIPNNVSPLHTAQPAPPLSAPGFATPGRIEALPAGNPMGRMQLHDSPPASWAGGCLLYGIPQGTGFLEHPPAKVPSVRYRFLVPAPIPAILEVHPPNDRVGGLRVSHSARLRYTPSSIEKSLGRGELRPCREQMLAVLPDLIPAPRPLPVLGGPRPPMSVPEVASHPGFDPLAADRFLRMPYRTSPPPAFAESREREFPLRPSIRCAATPARAALGEAGPATSLIRHVPDSPASLVFPKKIFVNEDGVTVAGLHFPVETKVALFSRHAIAASAAAQGHFPERLASLVFPKRVSVNGYELTVADLHVADWKGASFARRAIEPLPPAKGETTSGEVSSKSWVSSNRTAFEREPLVHLLPLAPKGAAYATILPPQVSWSSALEELRERIFNPRIKSDPRLRFSAPDLKTRKAALPISKLPVPLDFRWQRERKQWDRAARWKRRGSSVRLPEVSLWPGPSSPESLLQVVGGTSQLGRS